MQKPTVTSEEQLGRDGTPHCIFVCTDYHDGRGPRLSVSIPSGWGSYPEARARVIAEARIQAADEVAKRQARWAAC
jgi:hypothetical protein